MRGKRAALQGLRAVGIISIVVYHCANLQQEHLAGFGVCLFFVISGYLRGTTLSPLTKSGFTPAGQGDPGEDTFPSMRDAFYYALSRIAPLYPLHVIMTLAAVPVSDILPSLSEEGPSKLPFWGILLIMNLTLTKSLYPKYYFGYNGASWFLSSYFIMLLFTPLIQWAFHKYMTKKRLIPLAAVLFAVYLSYCYLIFRITPNIEFWTYIFPFARLPEYLIGMCVGALTAGHQEDREEQSSHAHVISIFQIGVVAVLIALIFFADIPYWLYRSAVFIIPVTALIALSDREGTVLNRLLSVRALVLIGNLSAYIFLIHQVLYRYALLAGVTAHTVNQRIVVVVCVMVLSLILSFIYEKICADRITRRLKRA